MVARALTLRYFSFAARFRGGFWGAFSAAALCAVAVLLAVTAGLNSNNPQLFTPQQLQLLDALLIASVLISATAVPLLRAERILGVRQFVQFPLSLVGIRLALFGSSLVVPAALLMLVYAVSRMFARTVWLGSSMALELLALVLLWLGTTMCAVCAAAIGQLWLSPGRRHVLSKWIGYALAAVTVPFLLYAIWEITSSDAPGFAAAGKLFAYTPLLTPVSVTGVFGVPALVVSMLTAVVFCAVLAVVYVRVTTRLAESIEQQHVNRLVGANLGWFDYFPDTPSGVIAARTLTYWRRDPRYIVGLMALPIAALLVVLALFLAGVEPATLALIPVPLMLYLLGWSIHNDIAMDSTAIWMHVASNTRGRDDRVGRLAPVVIVGLPLLVVGTTLAVIVSNKWHQFPVLLGLNAALLLIGAAVSSLASAWVVYPSTRPGESPFQQPLYAEAGAGVAQLVSFFSGLLLALPTVLLSVHALSQPPNAGLSFAVLAVGLLSGCGALLFSVWLGGIIFDRTAPEIVRTTEVFD